MDTPVSNNRLSWDIVTQIWLTYVLCHYFVKQTIMYTAATVDPTLFDPIGFCGLLTRIFINIMASFFLLKLTIEARWPLILTALRPDNEILLNSRRFLGCMSWRSAVTLWKSYIWRTVVLTLTFQESIRIVGSYIFGDEAQKYYVWTGGISFALSSFLAFKRAVDLHLRFLVSVMESR